MLAATAAQDPSAINRALDFLRSGFEDSLVLFCVGLALLILFFWYFATDVERRKRNVGTVLLIGITGLCLLAATPPHERLKGGIDILGGSAFTLRVQPREAADGTKQEVTVHEVDQAIVVIEKRLNVMGTAEPVISRQGNDGIIVQMPGVEPEESKAIRKTLEKVAKLELREVSTRNDEVGQDGKTLAQRVYDGSEIVPGYKALLLKGKTEEGQEYTQPILLSRRTALGGSDVASAYPSPTRQDAVAVTLNGAGADKMIELTKDMRPGVDRIAIVLDGEVINAPVVNDTPLGKNFEVSGLHEPGEPKALSDALMNPLENPLIVEQERSVSASLGSAIVKQGIIAGLIGLAITFLCVLLYYRMAGIIALVGLIVNGIILFGIMAMFGFTFSLPGIAGVILSIGMAVDANVLIYERLREELEAGKSLRNAIGASYEKAFSAILDANVTSLISAIILFWLGSGAIKGFAITLTIGIIASMFSAILVTRVLFRWGTDLNLLKKLTFLNLVKKTRFDFLGKGRICAIISAIFLVLAVSGFFIHKDQSLGVDFTGGTLIQFQLGDKKVDTQQVNKILDSLQLTKNARAQEESNPATGTLLSIRADVNDTNVIVDKLRQEIPVLAEKKEGTDSSYVIPDNRTNVSAVIGETFMKEAALALVLGLVGIMIYMTIRFEFSFALGGFVALLHDIVISVGLIVLLGNELSLIHVGAILTIAGYSINDTIVVFDRVRESFLLRRGGSTKDVMNEAVNATLSRTLLTSATTIITVMILSFFGGSELRDFSLMILIGLLVGTYSSIFVASPVVLWWSTRKGGSLRDDVVKPKAEALSAPASN